MVGFVRLGRLAAPSRPMTAIPKLPQTGLISEWRFTEGSGTTVADAKGSNPINLNLPTTPNYTWDSQGITLAGGLIQTPSLTGVRTVCMLYRTGREETPGFLISGGPGGSGGGLMQNYVNPGYVGHIGFGHGIRPSIGRSDGIARQEFNRGGWAVVFWEVPSAGNYVFGLGGRHSATTARCPTFSIAWAAAYSGQLSGADRAAILAYAATLVKPRGVYVRTLDAPVQANAVLLLGQSNAEGRAPISGLSAPDQARTYTRTYIEAANLATRGTPPTAVLALGANQTLTNPATQFGPEIGLAMTYEDTGPAAAIYISKTAAGSTFMAPVSVGAPITTSNTWHPGDVAASGSASLYIKAVVQDWFATEQRALLDGVGLNLKAVLWMQGEQDATSTVAAPNTATCQANLQAIYDAIKVQTALPNIPMHIARIRDVDPTMNATAKAAVRAGQAAFVAANAGCTLIDTDDLGLLADNVHYNAAGMKTLGQRFEAAVVW